MWIIPNTNDKVKNTTPMIKTITDTNNLYLKSYRLLFGIILFADIENKGVNITLTMMFNVPAISSK